ncbi:sensor domain-containing diguanylate cyclase [uncultured Sphaerochaeta sp.]|uniref:sensor domain-containing diguanylate cyclase n=1 Tax=uncultured Sphaerochaeta sp. TaxID=886478 RepID=UPI002A0A85B9|nr:sensor domain-containing diguanylate cyclase [uncultured Sphaerochaeta sp.]
MLDSIRVIMVLEATGSKELLANYLKSQIEHITHVDTMVDALSTVKRQRFDVAILSNDLEDYYSIENMIKILNDIGSIDDILLVSEKELPPDSPVISLENQMEAHVRILRELEKFSLHTGAKPLRKRATKGGSLANTSLFDSVPSGLYRIKPTGEFVELNQTLANIFKAPSIEVMESDNYFSMFVDQEELKTWQEIIERDENIHGLVFEVERYDGQTIWIRDTVRTVYNEDEEVCFYDGSAEDISAQKRLEDKLAFLATQDILTGLPNRNFFHDQAKLTVSQARYSDDLVAFLVIDIDHFTTINENHGFKMGDKVLQIVASRVKAQLRKSDLVSRLGSDKFIVLLNGIRMRRDALAVAKKIQTAFATPFELPNTTIEVSASLGISLYPEHGDDINTLIKRAEIATYAVKDRERGGYMIYSDILYNDENPSQDEV